MPFVYLEVKSSSRDEVEKIAAELNLAKGNVHDAEFGFSRFAVKATPEMLRRMADSLEMVAAE